MKTVLLLALILYAASAAPAEDKQEAPEAEEVAVVDAPEEQMAAAPGQEEVEAAPEARFNPCPNGWSYYGGRCFMFVRSPRSWYSAEEYCSRLGGHLASVTNSGEYRFLQQITQRAWESTAWLGGFNLQGRWMWTDSKRFSYTNWYSQSSSSAYPCTFLRTSYGWGNQRCSSSYCFICSKNPYGC